LRRTPDPDSLTGTPKKAVGVPGKSGRVIHLTAFGGTMTGAMPALPPEPHVTELH
jgi:hypothetical protein